MAESAQRPIQGRLFGDESPTPAPSEGPVARPPAPSRSPTPVGAGSRPRRRRNASGAGQLPLPLHLLPSSEELPAVDAMGSLPTVEPEGQPPAAPRGKGKRGGRPRFLPVNYDPDVARSHSDNAALDAAIAQGLARALSSLPPEALAALRAKLRGTKGN